MRPRRCRRDRNKVIFRTELDAKISLSRRRDNNIKAKVPVRYYRCPFSPDENPHFHTTSEKERNVGESGEGQEDEIARTPNPWQAIHAASLRCQESTAS